MLRQQREGGGNTVRLNVECERGRNTVEKGPRSEYLLRRVLAARFKREVIGKQLVEYSLQKRMKIQKSASSLGVRGGPVAVGGNGGGQWHNGTCPAEFRNGRAG